MRRGLLLALVALLLPCTGATRSGRSRVRRERLLLLSGAGLLGVDEAPVRRPRAREAAKTTRAAAGLAAGLAALSGLASDVSLSRRPAGSPGQPQAPFNASAPGDAHGGAPRSCCSAAAQALLQALAREFDGSASNSSSSGGGFARQQGFVDFGLSPPANATEHAGGDSAACVASQACAFSNPSGAYGAAVLPLSPGEDLAAKLSHPATPAHAAADLDGRYGPRLAPSWQLRQDEVVLLAGCTPPAEASRYFGVTGYLYSAFLAADEGDDADGVSGVSGGSGDSGGSGGGSSRTSSSSGSSSSGSSSGSSSSGSSSGGDSGGSGGNAQPAGASTAANATQDAASADSGSWLKVFGSLGDSLSLLNQPWGPVGRLQTSAPLRDSNSSSGNASAVCSSEGSSSVGGGGGSSSSSSASQGSFSALFVVLMGANPRSIEAARALVERSMPAAAAGLGGGSRLGGASAAAEALRGASVNVLPIPGPEFGQGVGLSPTASYFTLIVRNILPASGNSTAAFAHFLRSQPSLAAWRLTPAQPLDGASAFPAARVVSRRAAWGPAAWPRAAAALQGPWAAAAAGNTSSDAGGGSPSSSPSPSPGPSPSSPSSASTAVILANALASGLGSALAARAALAGRPPQPLRLQQPLQPRSRLQMLPSAKIQQQQQQLDGLLQAVRARFSASHAMAHGLGSASALGLLGVDWGRDCLARQLDWCNGDNRDAIYLSALPVVTLRPGQLLLVAGLQWVGAGLARYANVALTDALHQRGVLAWDDAELAAAAPAAAAALNTSVDGLQHGRLFLVAFARDCQGSPLPCKTVPRSVPPSRPLMTVARLYMSPLTGVGPHPDDVLPYATVVLTPLAAAVPADSRPPLDPRVWQLQDDAPPGAPSDAADWRAGVRAASMPDTAATLPDAAAAAAAAGGGAVKPDWRSLAARHAPPHCSNDSSARPGVAAFDGSDDVGGGLVADPCVRSLVGLSQCAPGRGLPDVCCRFVDGWSEQGCWCQASGLTLLANSPQLATRSLLQLLGWACE